MPPIPEICRVIFSKPEAALISSRASVYNPNMMRGGKTKPRPARTINDHTRVISSVWRPIQANQYVDAAARRKPSTKKRRGLSWSHNGGIESEQEPTEHIRPCHPPFIGRPRGECMIAGCRWAWCGSHRLFHRFSLCEESGTNPTIIVACCR